MIPLRLSKNLILPEFPRVVPLPANDVPLEAVAPEFVPVYWISPDAGYKALAFASPFTHNLLLPESHYCTVAVCDVGVMAGFVHVSGSPAEKLPVTPPTST